jgi:hypothetical protein
MNHPYFVIAAIAFFVIGFARAIWLDSIQVPRSVDIKSAYVHLELKSGKVIEKQFLGVAIWCQAMQSYFVKPGDDLAREFISRFNQKSITQLSDDYWISSEDIKSISIDKTVPHIHTEMHSSTSG